MTFSIINRLLLIKNDFNIKNNKKLESKVCVLNNMKMKLKSQRIEIKYKNFMTSYYYVIRIFVIHFNSFHFDS